jgi:iron complex outermembrane receptor protein
MNRMTARARPVLLAGAALEFLFGIANIAAAQPAAPAAEQAATLGEIVVTAQKREQNLQDVPVAVTAVNQDTLKANRVVNVMDLSGLAPGLLARANAGSLGSPSYSMRGVFASSSQPSSDRQISTYLDGVYIGSTRGSVFDLPDVDHVEVLRGPQGTLFGRNATAGAISVTTRDPTGQFHVRQELTGGNYGQFRTRTSVDLPAMGPFSAYVTYVHDQRRGDTRNLGAGTVFDRTSPFTDIGQTSSPKWLGSRNFNNFFVAAKYQPNDDFSIVYKYDRSQGTNTPEARVPTAINPSSLIGSMLEGVLAAQPAGGGAFGPVFLYPNNKRPEAVNNAWTQEGYLRAWGHNITINYRINDSLSVKNVTAYRYSTAYGPSTIAGLSGLQFTTGAVAPYAQFAAVSSVPGFSTFPAATQAAILGAISSALTPAVGLYFAGYEGNSWGEGWQFSNETQVNYDSKYVTFTAGGLYYHAKETDSGLPGMAPNFAFAPTPSLLPLGNVQIAQASTISWAGYAQAEAHVTPKLDVVFGGRWTHDRKVGALTSGGAFVGDRDAGGVVTGTAVAPWAFDKSRLTYSAGLNYKPTDDILLYGKYSTGFLSGGAVGPFTFAPETVGSGEVGVKSEWLDRRLRANLALYHAKYEHSQSSQSGQNVGQPQLGVVVIDNGPLEARGFEVEATALPMHGLTVGGSLSYTHAKLTDPNPIATQGKPYALTGVPKWMGAVNGQYQTDPLWNDAYLYVRLDANYTGRYRAIPYTQIASEIPVFAPFEFVPKTWLVNTRVALRDIKAGAGKAEIAFWVRNLFDNKSPVYPLQFGDFETNTSFQPARTIGVDVIFDY